MQPAATGARAAAQFPKPWQWRDPETGELIDSETLITDNLKLARKYAWNWARKSGMAYDDLEAVAFVGLVKGCRRFDPASGYRLSTICVPYINGEILHYFRDKGYAIKFPARWRERMPRARRLLEQGATVEAVCQALDLSPDELAEMLNAMAGTSELNEEVLSSDHHGSDTPIGEAELGDCDAIRAVQRLTQIAWQRIHSSDQLAISNFWSHPPRRGGFPLQALSQFLVAARLALQGQRLPEVREQLCLAIEVQQTPRKRKAPLRSRPSAADLAAIRDRAVQLGLLDLSLFQANTAES